MRVGVVTFPGTLDDRDAARAVRAGGAEAVSLWHGDADLKKVDAVILPGGFSYGDYLRCGAIARFSPVASMPLFHRSIFFGISSPCSPSMRLRISSFVMPASSFG